jgi:hypothetical protein
MRVVLVFAAVSLSLVVATPVAAQEFKPPANLFAQQKKPVPKPQVDWNWRPSAGATAAARATVVCGMTLVPADPKMDAGIRVTAPDSHISYTLRSVRPEICKIR